MMGNSPKVLILHVAESSLEPAYTHLLDALGDTPSVLFDRDLSVTDQMTGKEVVIDIGGWGRREHIEAAKEAGVKLWQMVGYGLDHLALEDIQGSGIPLARTPGPTTAIPLAEHAMFLMLSVQKQANLARPAIEEGHFFDGECSELAGGTLAIIGLGASGRELAKRARGFDMRILAVEVVQVSESTLVECGIEKCVFLDQLHAVLAEADFVSLHLPLNEETRHIIGGAELNVMKPTAVVINVARGALIDETALISALVEGRLRGAGLDVFEMEPLRADHPFFAMQNVVITPHWAAATGETFVRRSQVAADNVTSVLDGGTAKYLVS